MPGRELIKQWLKAGYVEAETFHRTETGTPQGGIISPLLLNIALNGMEWFLGPRYGFVRYTDDFIVCARTRDEIEAAQLKIAEWLEQRGLVLHPEKTRIVHIDDGFNFLAFSVRRYKGSCFLKPQKEKVLAFLARIRQWLSSHRQTKAEDVIRHLNPILRGWANYYKTGVSKKVFSYISHQIWQMLWRWCLRQHPKKGKNWVFRKYFQDTQKRSWNFHGSWTDAKGETKRVYLFDICSVVIKRHVKVRALASPDDPTLIQYWRERRARRLLYPLEQLTLKA